MTQPREVIRLREVRGGHKVWTEVKVADITHFIAGHKYVTAYFPGGEQLLKDSIVKLEEEFAADFISPHRAVLVRKALVERLDRDECRLFLRGVSEPVKASKLRFAAITRLIADKKRQEAANG